MDSFTLANKIIKLSDELKTIIERMQEGEFVERNSFESIEKDLEDISIAVYGKSVGLRKFRPLKHNISPLGDYLTLIQVGLMCAEASRAANEAEQEAQEIKANCTANIKSVVEWKLEYESVFIEKYLEKHESLECCFQAIDIGLTSNDYEYTLDALLDFANALTIDLKMKDFEEFDVFMSTSTGPLKL